MYHIEVKMVTERLSILAATAALREFTIPELIAYTGANPNTVRQVLKRDHKEGKLFERVASSKTTGRASKAGVWRLTNPEAILEQIAEEESAIAELRGLDDVWATNDSPNVVRDRSWVVIASAEDAVARAFDDEDATRQRTLAETALNFLRAADPSPEITEEGSEWWEQGPRIGPVAQDPSYALRLRLGASQDILTDLDLDRMREQRRLRAHGVALFAQLVKHMALGKVIDTDHLTLAAEVIANDVDGVSSELTRARLRWLTLLAATQKAHLPPVAVVTEPGRSPEELFPGTTLDQWHRSDGSIAQGMTYSIWYQEWAKPLFNRNLVPVVVVSHHDTPKSNKLLEHILEERRADLIKSRRSAMVVASNTEGSDFVAGISLSGATFYPLRSTLDDLRGAVSNAVRQVVNPAPSGGLVGKK